MSSESWDYNCKGHVVKHNINFTGKCNNGVKSLKQMMNFENHFLHAEKTEPQNDSALFLYSRMAQYKFVFHRKSYLPPGHTALPWRDFICLKCPETIKH